MARAERLGALDAAFVALESPTTPFVVGATLIFERAPLSDGLGRVDLERLYHYVGAAIDRLPRYRQRLARIPFFGHPLWIDDDAFDLARHLRVALLPPPGTDEVLARVTGRILSEDMPPEHPPWQLWVLDGLADGTLAMVAKVHHGLVDGVSGVRLLEHILRASPDATMPERISCTIDRPPPGYRLVTDELTHRAARVRAFSGHDVRRFGPALGALIAQGLHPASDAGINRRLSRERSFASCNIALDDMKELKSAFGVTLNDVALAVAAGALRRFLLRRGVDVASLRDFRSMVPVSIHPPDDTSLSGSRVALLLTPLPVAEPDPERRIARVAEATRSLKQQSGQAEAGELLTQLSEATSPHLLSGILRLALWRRAFNVVITNVPGPPMPLYLLGARMRRFCAIVNLWPRQTLGIALMSYAGQVCWGFHADSRRVPDLSLLVSDVQREFAELRAIAKRRRAAVTAALRP